ncbi:MAG TPA: Rieske (2Fe-2S) protein [Bryobacteraceae bacterium]|jgi:nitrite reductase/ring-hydroxylating ferredoxin subunit
MALVKILDMASLRPGSLRQLTAGGRSIALCRTMDNELHALAGDCPHSGAPLGHGALHGHTIVCPWHAWEFDCRTGACDFNDARLEIFPTRIQDASIWIELEDHA